MNLYDPLDGFKRAQGGFFYGIEFFKKPIKDRGQDGGEQIVFSFEMIKDQGFGHTRFLGDLECGGAIVTLFRKKTARGFKYIFSSFQKNPDYTFRFLVSNGICG